MLISKLQAKLLTWVGRAKEIPPKGKKPMQEILTGVHFEGNDAIAADGFRLHAVKDVELPDLVGRTVKLTKVSANTASVDVVKEPEGNWPNYRAVLPGKEPGATVYVDARRLIDALTGLETVKLVLRDKHTAIEVFGQIDDRPVYALIMPMGGYDDADTLTWRPG